MRDLFYLIADELPEFVADILPFVAIALLAVCALIFMPVA